MPTKNALVALAITFAIANAYAQEATPLEQSTAAAAPSMKTRAQVRAEVLAARERGEVIPALAGEATVFPDQAAATRRREDVRRQTAPALPERHLQRPDATRVGG